MNLKSTKKWLTVLLSAVMILTMLPVGTISAATVVNEWSETIEEPENNFRFGVMSDAHADWSRIGNVLDAYSKVGGVDALALVGDIAYNSSTHQNPSVPDNLYDGLISLMDEYGYDVPDANNAVMEGKLPMVYSLGNHEFPLNDSTDAISAQSKALFVEKLGVPDEEKDGNWSAEIGGYTFIMPCAKDYFGNYTSAEEWVLAEIAAAEAKNSTKPIFYLQHHGISENYNSAEFIAELKKHPRVIAVTAHTHNVADDTTMIEQDGYMSVKLPKVSGGNVSAQGGLYEMNLMEDSSSVAFLFDVTTASDAADTVTIYRMDILSGKLMGNPYVFTVGEASSYTDARYSMNKSKASFGAEDKLTVSNVNSESRDVKVSFPAENITITEGADVELLEDNFVHSYKVVLKEKTTGVVQQEKKVFGDFWRSEQFTPAKTRSLTLTDLERATNYVVSVYPLTTYQKNMTEEELTAAGVEPITSEFTSSYLKTDADRALISTKLVNVALRKPITTENLTESSSYPTARIVDGNDTNRMNFTATADGKASVTIDLKKRYNIETIELITNGSTIYETFGFTFYGSNDADFADATVIGTSLTYYNGEVLAQGGTYKKDVTAEKDFRYIKMERNMKAGDSVAYKELKIWANQDVTEVSRKKTVTASSANSNYPASRAVDGANAKGGDAWVSGKTGYHNITIDLGSLKHIGLIELEARLGDGNTGTSHAWKPYGSTTYVSNSDLSESSTLPEGYTALSAGTSNTNAGTLYLPSGYNKTEAPKVSLMTDSDETPYRFITIFNSNKTNAAKSLGEVRAFVLNPMINRIESTGNMYTVYFSDVMDSKTLTSDNIKAYNSSSVEQDAVITPSEDGYSVTIEVNGINGGMITISDAVTNTYGVDMAAPISYQIENTTTSYEGMPTKTVELNVAQYKPVSIGKGTENASYPTKNMTDGNRYTFAETTYTNQITVDLMRRYNVKRIELYSRHDYANEAWCSNFKVYGSNDENFSEKTELESYGAYNEEIFPVKGGYSFDVDDSKAYRYIRIEYPTSTTWLPMGDIRVFADVDVTQVTKKGMAVTTYPVKSSYPGKNLIDGSNSTFVYPGSGGNYAFFSIDMGEAYPIGMIEMDSRKDGGDGYMAHYGISTYGSNKLMEDTANAAKSKLTSQDGYTRLTWIQTANNFPTYDATNPDTQFKRYSKNTDVFPCYREAFVDEANYRYLTIKDDETTNCYQASEVRAYVINPMITGVSVDGNTITVGFSDEMIASLMTTDNIVLKKDGNAVDVTDATLSEDGYEFSFTADLVSGETYTVEVSKNVRSKNGVTMQNDESVEVEISRIAITDADGNAVEALANNTTYTVNVETEAEVNSELSYYVAAKDKTTNVLQWVAISDKTVTEAAFTHTFTFTTDSDASNEYLEIFVWEKGVLSPIYKKYQFFK